METKEDTPEEEKKAVERTDVLVQMMDNIVDKLQLLAYEKKMRQKKRFVPCSRFYFCLAEGNAQAQFNYFMDLVVFLTKECRREFTVDKYDDPNTSVNKLLLLLKAMSIEINFSAAKIKLGHGEAVCTVLQHLADAALAEFHWTSPEYPREDFADEGEADDEAEIDGDDVEDNVVAAQDDDDDDNLYSAAAVPPNPSLATNPPANDDPLGESQSDLIQATVDPMAWRTELERVAPKLKSRVKADVGKEWRAHIEQTRTHEETIKTLLPPASNQLKQVALELSEALERMRHKEKYINGQFNDLREAFADAREHLARLSETAQATSDRVTAYSTELSQLSDQLTDVKARMDSRGSSMTDTTPLVKIKEALGALKREIKQYELRIGIVGHSLLQVTSRIKPRRQSKKDDMLQPDDPAYDESEEEY